jgi:N-acetylmuramoyl-L-alanine amidase
MKRTSMAIALLFAIMTVCQAANTVALLDSLGQFIGNLPVVTRGDDRLIPLSLLVQKAGWQEDNSEGRYVVILPGATVILRRGNPFARLNNGFMQLRVVPDEWDGSLWVALSNLPDLFASALRTDAVRSTIVLPVLRNLPPPAAPAPAPAPAPKSEAPDTSRPRENRWSLKTVIIDPGHGGKDPGAVGLLKQKEKTITLDVARRLAALLIGQGIKYELTRDADEFVSLKRRTQFANQQKGDLFLSIHCNSNRDPTVQGASTYFLKPARTQRAIEAATRENSVVQLEDSAGVYQDLTQENFILMTMATSQYMKDSEAWAAFATQETIKASGLESRGVDQAGFYVLIGASMPAILVECGYISNPEDVRVLSSERGRQKIAEGLLQSILSVKQELEAAASR